MEIVTYGTRFGRMPAAEFDVVFDASKLYSPKVTKGTRGTQRRFQTELFHNEEVEAAYQRLLEQCRAEGVARVAVFCRNGHHRSVALAERLGKELRASSVTHRDIDKEASSLGKERKKGKQREFSQ